MPVKRIVCLANSYKFRQRCIAGKEVGGEAPGAWIRPVSNRAGGAVNERERQYARAREPSLMDLIDLSLVGPRPMDCQRENWILDPRQQWQRAGSATWAQAVELVDPVGPLWVNGHHTRRGLNDEIPVAGAMQLQSSLRLVRVDSIVLCVMEYYGRKVLGRFRQAGEDYKLAVTDPSYKDVYARKKDGEYPLGECLITVSISEPFEERNACYKLIAGIVERG